MLACAHTRDGLLRRANDVWCGARISDGAQAYAPAHVPSSSGAASRHIHGGSTSGTPPTRVLTTSSPADAASMSDMPNASVRLVLRKI